MAKDRRKPRKGRAGDCIGTPIPRLDAGSLLLELATKAKTPNARHQGRRAPRSRDGQATNYAGFGDQYFRLKSSLVRETHATHKRKAGRLVRAEQSPEDRERWELKLRADELLRQADEDSD
jgi:hypothetical protein